MKTILSSIKYFIESNRQTGTTTALIKATKETNGYLVVGNLDVASSIIKNHPELRGHVLALSGIDAGDWRGRPSGPLFFDTTAVIGMMPKPMDGYQVADTQDGYHQKNTEQFNMKLTSDDIKEVEWINRYFYEGELTNSTLGRILIRKGVQWYKNLSR